MITKKVTDDDHFMELSASAQALYLHLSMAADDDGFCNQVAISMFKAHASVQDLQALLEKRYIYQFDNGVIVIKHWRMANALRKDRYTPTAFQEEFKKLKLKENGVYTLVPDGCQVDANCLPQIRLDKDRLDQDRLIPSKEGNSEPKKGKKQFIAPTFEEVKQYCIERNSTVDPRKFFDYYDVGGWKDSKGNPVRNWKQKLLTWERKGTGKKPEKKTNNIFLEMLEEENGQNTDNFDPFGS